MRTGAAQAIIRGRRHRTPQQETSHGAADSGCTQSGGQLRAVVRVPHAAGFLPAAGGGGGGGTGHPLPGAALRLQPEGAGPGGPRGRAAGQRCAGDHAQFGRAECGADGLPHPEPQLRRPGAVHRRAAGGSDGGVHARHPQHGGAGPARALGGRRAPRCQRGAQGRAVLPGLPCQGAGGRGAGHGGGAQLPGAQGIPVVAGGAADRRCAEPEDPGAHHRAVLAAEGAHGAAAGAAQHCQQPGARCDGPAPARRCAHRG